MFSFLFVLGVMTASAYGFHFYQKLKSSGNRSTVIVPRSEYEDYLRWRNTNTSQNSNVAYSSTSVRFPSRRADG